MNECDVRIFSLSTCIHCRDTKEFFKQCGIAYDCVEVDKLEPEERSKVLEDLKHLNPACSFPTIIVGDKIIIGLRKEEIKEILGIK